ncbi:amidase [Cochlodiniinecator piscidefendens]|uniref:amidase n=1 Tax=Cochlodiniinecator piscidefendens TaxID=2715756 RepID=UPI00140BA6B8|nr:amidase [Cochlodiniinecator piscidefendens]
MAELNTLSAVEIVAQIRKGIVTPSEVMAACLNRIKTREPEIGAFIHLEADRAMERAKALDDLPPKGALFGVPFAVKDIIDTDDMPTRWGSPIYENRKPERNASCVEAFIAAGAIPIGKTVTTEFAYFQPGKTANPHNTGHTPGGSSSGSAAAVADHMVPLAFGSQTAASLIRPAAYCGISAFRPTTGGFNLQGVMGLSHSLDTLGVLARTVPDLSLCREVLMGDLATSLPEIDEDSLPCVGLMRGPNWWDGSIEMRNVCTTAMGAITATGANTGDVSTPPSFTNLTQAQITVMAYETARTRICEYSAQQDQLSPQFAALIEDGRNVSDTEYQRALSQRERSYAMLEAVMGDCDVLLAPSAPGEAPAGLGATGDPLYSRMWNLLQVPTVALPFLTGPNGLPTGIQLIAKRGHDAKLLAVAEWLQNIFQSQNKRKLT